MIDPNLVNAVMWLVLIWFMAPVLVVIACAFVGAVLGLVDAFGKAIDRWAPWAQPAHPSGDRFVVSDGKGGYKPWPT